MESTREWSRYASSEQPHWRHRYSLPCRVLQVSFSIKDETLRSQMGSPSVAGYYRVAFPEHPQYERLAAGGVTTAGYAWRYLDKDLLVINSYALSPAPAQAPKDATFRTVDVEDIRIKGVSVWDELQRLKARDASLPRSDHRADLGEWMAFKPGAVQPQAGDLVECLGAQISLEITYEPGSTLFVVSTDPVCGCRRTQDSVVD